MKPNMSKEDWLLGILDLIEPVGECEEWQGTLLGRVPVGYTPRGYLFEGNSQGKHSVRSIAWRFKHLVMPPAGKVVRMTCCNDRCVAIAHMQLMTRADSVREQFRRGEHNTPARRAAVIQRARANPNAKLTIEGAREIRASEEADEVLSQRFGICAKRVGMVRRGEAWPELASGASVFNWRP